MRFFFERYDWVKFEALNMKMKLKKSVFFFLSLTVLAPIVLYTDTLGAYFTSLSSRDEFGEEVSTLTFTGDVGPLNVLPQESSTELKEPNGVVYLDGPFQYSSNYSNASSGENAHNTRELSGELVDNRTTNSSILGSSGNKNQSWYENPLKQVTETVHEAEFADESSNKTGLIGGTGQNNVKKQFRYENSVEPKDQPQSSRSSSGDGARKQVKGRIVKQNEQRVFLDAQVHQFKDQLVQAKVYLSLAATRNNLHFLRELKSRMKEVQRTLGDATKDSDLPRNAFEKLKAMEQTLLKGKQIHDDSATMIKKLRTMIHLIEERLPVQKKQTLYLTHLAAKTMPKGLHCLPLLLSTEYFMLSTEYFMLNSSQQHFSGKQKLDDLKLYHYALFSDNVLAAAAVVNSTISRAKDPSKHVFHVVTDRLNYAAMKMWFLTNPPGKATIQVQNVEEFKWLNSSYSPVLKQLGSSSMIDYYFKNRHAESDSNIKFRNPKYLSIMNHLRFYLPEIFPKLDKVLFLDDDIVVQKDLTGLWSLDLKGKVIGVVETCGEHFHRFDRYLNFSNPFISKNFDPQACGWAFGMNIVDLDKWRKQNITEVYHKWQNLNHDRLLWKLGTLPPGLLTFWNHTYPLEKFWHVLGLGYDPSVPQKDILRAAVIHYNGNLKPWLEIGIPKFRNYWARFVDYEHRYLRQCNIAP